MFLHITEKVNVQTALIWVPPTLLQTAEVAPEAPFQMNTMNVMSPYGFKDWLEKQRATLASGGPIDMFGAQFETEVQ